MQSRAADRPGRLQSRDAIARAARFARRTGVCGEEWPAERHRERVFDTGGLGYANVARGIDSHERARRGAGAR